MTYTHFIAQSQGRYRVIESLKNASPADVKATHARLQAQYEAVMIWHTESAATDVTDRLHRRAADRRAAR